MCTVSFVPGDDGIYHLTSNRDERISRPPALHPQRYDDITYPRDAQAGGSWIALRNNGDAAVLLNGAFEMHQCSGRYRMSRGLVFLGITRSDDPLLGFQMFVLEGIEPFTLILFSDGHLYECRWDGRKKHIRERDTGRPHIWSSVTLYDEAARRRREAAFAKWFRRGDRSPERILAFHRRARKKGDVATVSITTIRIGHGQGKLSYIELGKAVISRNAVASGKGVALRKAVISRKAAASRNAFLIRLRNWEFWPFSVVYAPMFLYWVWLSLRARSFFFFSTSNPGIRNAGFLYESKQQIYDLLPEGSFPRTLYCQRNLPGCLLLRKLAQQGLYFPMIAKPDIGQRGLAVQLLENEDQLASYARVSKVDFLLQEYIDYPLEAGIFYYRIPGQPKGFISGIVAKEMLTVTGDGHSTIAALLGRNERHLLQLPALQRMYGAFLQTIPPKGEKLPLSPYGNHSRGAKFLDHSYRITPRLEAAIDAICVRIPGFYFGRMDIKFNSWPELEAGAAFSIIELNGAGSEPTHIYDPKHSLFYAWGEIRRHWDILYAVSRGVAKQQGLSPMSVWEGLRMFRDYYKHEKLISQ